jgi:phosphate transport system substrate-binding protein
MNDDFLHRLRKAPPPEFLDGLKARIERQSPLARTRTRRSPFSRGLIVGLLLGGAAFAVTSLSVNRAPASFTDFLKAPAQLVARLGGRSSQNENSQQRRVLPWGPVWGPKHPAPAGEILKDTDSAAAVTNTPSPATTGRPPEADRGSTQTSLPATQSASPASRYFGFGFTVVAPPGTYPHAQAVAERLGNGLGVMRVSLETGGATVSRLCSADDKTGSADLIEVPGRITPAELRNCGSTITELRVGHQAIVIARSKLYGSMTLSARDLFLALARQVPVSSDPVLFMDNPYTTWNQIDATLPYDRIHLLGPVLGWVQGRLAAVLLLEAGCNTFPGIAELRVSDLARYEEICLNIRNDGAYEESAEGIVTYTERLARDPTLLGIITFSEFDGSKDRLAASVIDAVEPSPETIAAHTYPASRVLYLYTKQYNYTTINLFGMLMRAYLAPLTRYDNAPGNWGFVSLDAAEHADVEAILQGLHTPSKF